MTRLSRREVIRQGGGAALAVSGLGALLAACGGGDDEASGDDSAELERALRLHHDAAVGPLFAPYVEYFNENYRPLRLETSYVAQDYVGTTQTQLAGGSVDYDILFLDPGYAARWYKAGWIRRLDDIDGVDEIIGQIQPELVDSLKAEDGNLITLPYYRSVELFIYNAEHLDEIGAKPPATWDEFLETCRELKAEGVSATPYSPFWNREVSMIWYTLATESISDGAGDFFAEDFQPQFQDDPAVVRTLERWQTVYREGLAPQDAFTAAYGDTVNLFAGGKSSFTIRYGPQLKGFTDPKQSKVAQAARNALMPGSARASLSTGSFWTMAASTPAPQTAGRLLRYLAYKDEQGSFHVPTNLIAVDLGLQTPYDAVNTNARVRASREQWSDPRLIAEQYATSKSLGPAVNQEWYGPFIEQATAVLQDAVRGRKSAQDALAETADLVRAEL
jgi:ABC-type glycerol-3-phosphate transport system substrate-binding protein